MSKSCLLVYGINGMRVMPSRLATLGCSVRSGKSIVLATASTIRRLCGMSGQWNML